MTFDELYASLPADGWLARPEAALLWEVARNADGPILEVGCYNGRSTCLLAAAGKAVHVVDRFAGFDSDDPTGEAVRARFLVNLYDRNIPVSKRYAVSGGVQLFHCRVEDWDPLLMPRPAGLAYLDGDHTYRGTLAQVAAALAVRAKVIAAHDVNDSGGGLEVKRALVEALGPWDERAERLAVWRRGG